MSFLDRINTSVSDDAADDRVRVSAMNVSGTLNDIVPYIMVTVHRRARDAALRIHCCQANLYKE